MRPSFVYELRSINLSNLPGKEQGSVLDRFVTFLDSLAEPITIHIIHDEREVEAIGAVYQIPYKRFFVETRSQVDSLVQKLGTRMVRTHALPLIRTARVCPRTSSILKAIASRSTASLGLVAYLRLGSFLKTIPLSPLTYGTRLRS